MSPRIRMRRGEKYEDGEINDGFVFDYMPRATEQRVCQFKSEISTVGGSDRRFAHNFAVYGIHSRSTNLHNCTVNLLEAHHNSRFQLFVACVNHSVFLHFRFNCTV